MSDLEKFGNIPSRLASGILDKTKAGSKPFAQKEPEVKEKSEPTPKTEPKPKAPTKPSAKIELKFIDADKISPWNFADRGSVSLKKNIEALLSSIYSTKGNEQAIIVRPNKNKKGHYEAISGRTRLECCKELGFKVKCEVRELDDTQAYSVQFRENDKRSDIPLYDQCKSLLKALNENVYRSNSHAAIELEKSKAMIDRMSSILKNWGEGIDLEYYDYHLEKMGFNALEKLKSRVRKEGQFLDFFVGSDFSYEPTAKNIDKAFEQFQKQNKTEQEDESDKKSHFVKRTSDLGDLFSMDKESGKINILKHGSKVLSADQIIEILEREFKKAEKKFKD